MWSYALRRLALLVPALVGVVTLLFFVFTLLGDPAQMLAGQRADVQTIEAIRKDLGLDQPVWRQYLAYLNDLSPLGYAPPERAADPDYAAALLWTDAAGGGYGLKTPWLGRSYQNGKPVAGLYAEYLPGTLLLALASILLAGAVGISLGVAAAANYGKPLDRGLTALSMLGISTPSFFSAILAAWLFAMALHEYTGLDVTGYVVKDRIWSEGAYWDWRALVLPALTLGVRPLGVVFQLTRASMKEALDAQFVRTARAKGAPPRAVLVRHALRNALNPVLTSLSSWFGALLMGAFFVEYVFDWQGVGKLTVEALMTSDFPVLLGSCVLTAVLFTLLTLSVDLLYPLLDPRVRLED